MVTARPRIAVVTSVFGLPSEVWMVRQLHEFSGIEPVIFYEALSGGAERSLAQFEAHDFSTSSPGWLRHGAWRLRRRLGAASAAMYPLRKAEALRAALLAARVDAVLCHFAWNGIPVTQALRGLLPVVWQVHGRDVSSQLGYPFYRRALAATLPQVAHLVAVGRFQIDLLRPFGLPDRWSVIPCGAPVSQFRCRTAVERPGGDGGVRIVAVSRLSHEKGVLQTVEAFAQVHRRAPDTTLTIIGDGPLRSALETRIADLGLAEAVNMLGVQPPEAVARLLARSDIFTQHSQYHDGWIEGFGVTLTEAGATGLPLVVSAFGGIVDQVTQGENGLLFEPGNIEGQAQALQRLVADKMLRTTMGEAARTVALRYDSPLMTARLETVLKQAAGG